MRCRKCIKKIGTGEDKIQDQDLVKSAKRISSKFDIALQMWAKKGGKEDTARPVAQRARIVRNHIGGKECGTKFLLIRLGIFRGKTSPLVQLRMVRRAERELLGVS